MTEVAASAAAAVAAFFMKSRRGTPPAEEVDGCSITIYFNYRITTIIDEE